MPRLSRAARRGKVAVAAGDGEGAYVAHLVRVSCACAPVCASMHMGRVDPCIIARSPDVRLSVFSIGRPVRRRSPARIEGSSPYELGLFLAMERPRKAKGVRVHSCAWVLHGRIWCSSKPVGESLGRTPIVCGSVHPCPLLSVERPGQAGLSPRRGVAGDNGPWVRWAACDSATLCLHRCAPIGGVARGGAVTRIAVVGRCGVLLADGRRAQGRARHMANWRAWCEKTYAARSVQGWPEGPSPEGG